MTLTEEREDRASNPYRPYSKRPTGPTAKGNLIFITVGVPQEVFDWLEEQADDQARSRADVGRAIFLSAMRKDREKQARRKKKEGGSD
jgi:hypothetical protein